MTPEQIHRIKDPSERARAAQGFIERGDDAIAGMRAVRDAAIFEWRMTATQRDMAAALGVSPGLIGQIIANRQEAK